MVRTTKVGFVKGEGCGAELEEAFMGCFNSFVQEAKINAEIVCDPDLVVNNTRSTLEAISGQKITKDIKGDSKAIDNKTNELAKIPNGQKFIKAEAAKLIGYYQSLKEQGCKVIMRMSMYKGQLDLVRGELVALKPLEVTSGLITFRSFMSPRKELEVSKVSEDDVLQYSKEKLSKIRGKLDNEVKKRKFGRDHEYVIIADLEKVVEKDPEGFLVDGFGVQGKNPIVIDKKVFEDLIKMSKDKGGKLIPENFENSLRGYLGLRSFEKNKKLVCLLDNVCGKKLLEEMSGGKINPNANFNTTEFADPAYSGVVEYQTEKGSADDIKGQDKVNPFCVLRALGDIFEKHIPDSKAKGVGAIIKTTIGEMEKEGFVTPDHQGVQEPKGTDAVVEEFQKRVLEKIREKQHLYHVPIAERGFRV